MRDYKIKITGHGHIRRMGVILIIISMISSSLIIGFDNMGSGDVSEEIVMNNKVSGLIKLKCGIFDPLDESSPVIASSPYDTAPVVQVPYILQAPGKITEEWKMDITKAGAKIISYIPDNALLVTMNSNSKAKVDTLPNIRWCGNYEPAYKMEPGLATATGTVKLSITLFPGAVNGYIVKQITAVAGGKILGITNSKEVNTVNAEVDASLVDYLISRPEVKLISELSEAELMNDSTVPLVQSGGATRPLHVQGLDGLGEVVTICDTGINDTHQNFQGSIYGITGDQDKIKANYVPGDSGGEVGDESVNWNHGSFSSGVIAGDGAGYGTWDASKYDGHAYMAQIVMQDIGYDPGPMAFDPPFIWPPADNYNDLFKFTEDNYGSKIHSSSWGYRTGYSDESAMNDAYIFDSQDFSSFWPVGADGPAGTTISRQAEAKNVIGVGATINDGGSVISWSSRGPATDGRIKPDIVVPGEVIMSVDGDGATGYTISSGTSWSTAAAAGSAAMVRQYYREGWYPTGVPVAANGWSPSTALIKATMINGAVDLETPDVPNMNEGWGRLHLDNSLYFPGDAKEMMVIDQSTGMILGDMLEYNVSITDNSEPLRVSLVWSDFPGDPLAATALVNDLDLTLTAPGGAEYKGNMFSAGESITGGTYDVLNNVECAYLNSPIPGVYTIRIDTSNIVMGPQCFALVATGNFDDGYGFVAMDRIVYDDSDTINFRVEDMNVPGSTVDIVLTGSISGDSETITLDALDTGSYVFAGSVLTYIGTTVPGDGRLQVRDGETITATYSDPSPLHDSVAIAHIDLHGPVITNVFASEITGTSTIITWDTSESANSTVYYREFGSPTWELAYDNYLVMDHIVPLTGLSENTKYEFWVESTDWYGRSIIDDFAGRYYTFSTRSTIETMILLVDDDLGSPSDIDGSPFELDRMNNLEHNGWTYAHWDMNILGSPTTADLNQALVIMWDAGWGFPQLGFDDREALTGYLDQTVTPSGTVPMAYIVGQDIAWDLGPAGTEQNVTWLADYLGAEYVGDDADGGDGTEGGTSGPPSQDPMRVIDMDHPLNDIYNFDDIDLEEDTYGQGLFYPDDINAVAPGVASWDYNAHEYGGTCAGVTLTNGGAAGTARIAYNAFAHDMIDSTDNGGNWDPAGSPPTIDPERAGILDETIQWLLGGDHPAINLTDPTVGETITSTTTYTINWTVADAQSIEVYYSPNSGQEYIKLNGASLPGTQTSYTWDLSALEDGDNYRVKVVAFGTATHATLIAYGESGDFTIEHGVDNTPPITIPGSVETDVNPIAPGDAVILTATIDDSLTGESSITDAEWYCGATPAWPGTPMSVSDGVWDEINEDVTVVIPGAETATWSPGQWHKLWVRGQDSAGNWASSYYTDIYVIGPPDPPYEMNINTGWQFISFPVDITNTVDVIFDDSINGDGNLSWTMILWYDPLDDVNHWKSYNNNYLGTQDMPLMDNSMGIWILVTSNTGDNLLTMGVVGPEPASTTITLQAGWNMVGFPSQTEGYTAGDLKTDSNPMVTMIERYNGAAPYGIEVMPDGDAFQIGQAYWIYSTGIYNWVIP